MAPLKWSKSVPGGRCAFARRVQRTTPLQSLRSTTMPLLTEVTRGAVAAAAHSHPHAIGAGYGQAIQDIVFAGAKDDDLGYD